MFDGMAAILRRSICHTQHPRQFAVNPIHNFSIIAHATGSVDAGEFGAVPDVAAVYVNQAGGAKIGAKLTGMRQLSQAEAAGGGLSGSARATNVA
jgi:hypothetical protein